jgi:hypothetical protein
MKKTNVRNLISSVTTAMANVAAFLAPVAFVAAIA